MQNMEKFKPGVEGIVLIFSDNEGDKVYEFPYYTLLKAELEPLLLEVKAADVAPRRGMACFRLSIQSTTSTNSPCASGAARAGRSHVCDNHNCTGFLHPKCFW